MEPKKRLSRIAAALPLCGLALVGCGMPTAPTSPAMTGGLVSAPDALYASSGTPDDFAGRGWECRTSPVPGRVVCSPPNQGFPAVPPPADRPATYQLRAWEGGVFAGNILLIRPDLYKQQVCESTGDPYILRPVIGYYECLHTVGN